MIKQINKFIYQKCERRYGEKAMARKRRKELKKKRRALTAARREARKAKKTKLRAERLKSAPETSLPPAQVDMTDAPPAADKAQASQ